MVKVGDTVHVRGADGYGVVVEYDPSRTSPVCVIRNDVKTWEYESHVTVLTPPEIGPQPPMIIVSTRAVETLLAAFDRYGTHKECDLLRHDVTGECDCGYERAKAAVLDIRKVVGL